MRLQPTEGPLERRDYAVNAPTGEGDLALTSGPDLTRQLAGIDYQMHDAADMRRARLDADRRFPDGRCPPRRSGRHAARRTSARVSRKLSPSARAELEAMTLATANPSFKVDGRAKLLLSRLSAMPRLGGEPRPPGFLANRPAAVAVAICCNAITFAVAQEAATGTAKSAAETPSRSTEIVPSTSTVERVVYEISRLRSFDDERISIAVIVVATIGIVAGVWQLYRRDAVELWRGTRAAVFLLRCLALAGLIVFFLAIERRTTREVVHNSQVAVLVDVSQSMGLANTDAKGESSVSPRQGGRRCINKQPHDRAAAENARRQRCSLRRRR